MVEQKAESITKPFDTNTVDFDNPAEVIHFYEDRILKSVMEIEFYTRGSFKRSLLSKTLASDYFALVAIAGQEKAANTIATAKENCLHFLY